MVVDSFRDDYEALLEMARDKTAASREMLARAVEDLKSEGGDVLTDRERALMSGILSHVIHDIEMPLRSELAARLAILDEIPEDLVMALADEDIEVAYPILAATELLYDPNLIELIFHRTLAHQLSVAMRSGLGETVADAKADAGKEDVINSLLEDDDPGICQHTTNYLLEQSKKADTHHNPLLKREDLDPKTAERTARWVSAAIRKYLMEALDFKLDPTALDLALDESARDINAEALETGIHDAEETDLARRLAETERITSELMIKVLSQGEVPLFEALFAEETGLRRALLRRILFEPGGEALAVACKGIGMPKDDFVTLFTLTRKARPGRPAIRKAELTRVLELYDRIERQSARAIIGRWRRDSDYLNAVRVLSAVDDKGSGPKRRRAKKRPLKSN